MAVDPRTLGVGPVFATTTLQPRVPTFGETQSAAVGYYLDPAFERLKNVAQYGVVPEAGFDWRSSVPDRHAAYGSRYAYATNNQHAAEITRAIDESISRRSVTNRSPVFSQIVAEIANPVNFIGIPLGGPVINAGRVAVARTAVRGGVAAGATELGINLAFIQSADPVQSYTETFVNSASVLAFGAGFSALGAIGPARRINARNEMQAQGERLFRIADRAERIGNVDFGSIAQMQARGLRALGGEEGIEQINDALVAQIRTLEQELASVDISSPEAPFLQQRIDELRGEQQPYATELFYRSLEAEGINSADLYRPAGAGDSWFLNWVTTPMRRTLTADYGAANNLVKGTLARLAYDGGLQLEMHKFGVTDGLSVHQRAATEIGGFVRVNDDLQKLWATDTAAPEIGSSILAGADINATDLARRAQRQGNTFGSWLEEVNRRRVFGEEMNDAQAKAADMINGYFERWESLLIETGQLRTKKNIGQQITRLEQEVNALRAELTRADAGQKTSVPADRMQATLRSREELLAELQFELENPSIGGIEAYLPRYWNIGAVRRNMGQLKNTLAAWYRENPYIFSYNEKLKRWERVELATDPDSIARRVDETVQNIMNERPDRPADEVFLGTGRAGHIRARQLNIPNQLVWDFIEHNPVALMRNYTARVAPQYHFAKMFGGSRADVIERMRDEMRKAGQSERKIQAAVRDFSHMYDRVVGAVMREPEAWSQKVATVLRDATQLTYLGGSGIAALADTGRIVMENELPTLARSMQAMLDPAVRKASVRETRLAGAALELLLGSAGMRIVDDQNFNFLQNGTMDKVRNAFYTLNLLGPVTVLAKQFAGANGAHMLIEYSQKLARGEATEFETAYLARHGINAENARGIANAPWQTDPNSGLILPNVDDWEGNYVIPETELGRVNVIEDVNDEYVQKFSQAGQEVAARYDRSTNTIFFNRTLIEGEKFDQRAWTLSRVEGVTPLPEDSFPTKRAWSNFVMWHEIMHTRFSAEDLGLEPKSAAYENRINELAMAEHRKSTQVSRETAELFRGALNMHVNNVVMSATPADKPIIMDGVMYVRRELGERFGLKEDPNVPGYVRIENGLLALPLQFYSFVLANVNKTVGVMMQGAVRNRLMGVVAMMSMGYMISAIRTPDNVWDQMSPQDKFGRAFDMSGVAALYSDLFYTTLQTSLALGGPNITGGFIQPRYPQKPNTVDAVTNLTGAASGWTADMIRSANTFASGEYGEGASQFIRNLPFSNLWFLRDDVNQLGRYLAN
jgi:hypothetical protein